MSEKTSHAENIKKKIKIKIGIASYNDKFLSGGITTQLIVI